MSLQELLPLDAYETPEGDGVRGVLELCGQTLSDRVGGKLTTEHRDLLSDLQEKLACALVAFRVRTTGKTRVTFAEGERLVIDFGILDDRLIEDADRTVPFCLQELRRAEEISGLRIRYLTEMIDARFQTAQGIPQENLLQRKLAEARVSLATLKQDLKRLQVRRNKILRDHKEYQPLADLFGKLDRLLPSWAQAHSSMESAGDVSPKDRRAHHQLGQEYTALKDEESYLLGRLDKEAELTRLATDITASTMRIPTFERHIQKLHDNVGSVQAHRQGQSLPGHAARRVEELKDMLSHLRHCGGTFSRKAHTIMTKGKNQFGKLDIIRSVEAVVASDAELREKWKSGEWTRPHIGLLPGFGEAVYEEAGNHIWVPILLRRGPEKTMAAALGNYRLSACRNTLAAFGRLKTYQEVKSVRALREKFVQAYTAWSLRDSKGFRSLPREVRNWFIKRIYETARKEGQPSPTASS